MDIPLSPGSTSSHAYLATWLKTHADDEKFKNTLFDKWMTRESRAIRNTIHKEGVRLKEMGILEAIPNLKIIPELETIAERGTRKFIGWVTSAIDSIPKYIKSGIAPLWHHAQWSEFDDVEENPFYSNFSYWSVEGRPSVHPTPWREVCLDQAIIRVAAPSNNAMDNSFSSLESAITFTLFHEASHAMQAVRKNNFTALIPPIREGNPETKTHIQQWATQAFSSFFNADISEHKTFFQRIQTLWGEYYADAGAALLHARTGYSSDYLDSAIQARRYEGFAHSTGLVLQRVQDVLDLHPVVHSPQISSNMLHHAISELIAPQIAYDLLWLATSEPEAASYFETLLSHTPLPTLDVETYPRHEKLHRLYPCLSTLIAVTQGGPERARIESQLRHIDVEEHASPAPVC